MPLSKRSLVATIAVAVVITGCAATAQVGESSNSVAPKLIATGDRDKTGREVLVWDRPSAFGRVPEDKQPLGDATCLAMRADLEAVGYHPSARDRDGHPMTSGGFLCAVKNSGDRPSGTPPQIVSRSGVSGWDRPSAFGAVPSELQQRGDAVCRRAGPQLAAIGYHPSARNEQNAPILGGGFLCAPRTSL